MSRSQSPRTDELSRSRWTSGPSRATRCVRMFRFFDDYVNGFLKVCSTSSNTADMSWHYFRALTAIKFALNVHVCTFRDELLEPVNDSVSDFNANFIFIALLLYWFCVVFRTE